jgi:hypothetical protein
MYNQFLLTMSKHGEICIMDRQESNKEILRLYQTKERPAGIGIHENSTPITHNSCFFPYY